MNTMMMKLGLGLAVVLTMAGCAAEAGDDSAGDEQTVSAAPSIEKGGDEPALNAGAKRDMPMLAAPKHMLPVEKTGGEFGEYQPKLPAPGDPSAAY